MGGRCGLCQSLNWRSGLSDWQKVAYPTAHAVVSIMVSVLFSQMKVMFELAHGYLGARPVPGLVGLEAEFK